MSDDEIIKMAHECNVSVDWRVKNLVRFANLVAARERESCVNSHDLLISALTSARNRLADMLMNGGDDGQAWKEARKAMPEIEAALAKAQGGKE